MYISFTILSGITSITVSNSNIAYCFWHAFNDQNVIITLGNLNFLPYKMRNKHNYLLSPNPTPAAPPPSASVINVALSYIYNPYILKDLIAGCFLLIKMFSVAIFIYQTI